MESCAVPSRRASPSSPRRGLLKLDPEGQVLDSAIASGAPGGRLLRRTFDQIKPVCGREAEDPCVPGAACLRRHWQSRFPLLTLTRLSNIAPQAGLDIQQTGGLFVR